MSDGVEAAARRAKDYTDGSVARGIWLLALPMTLEMTVSNFFRIARLDLIACHASNGLAAVSLSGSVRWMLTSLAIGLGVGGAAAAARLIGEKDHAAASHTAT